MAQKMRAYFEELCKTEDVHELTPLYLERGIFVFDFYIEPADVCDIEDANGGKSSGNSRRVHP